MKVATTYQDNGLQLARNTMGALKLQKERNRLTKAEETEEQAKEGETAAAPHQKLREVIYTHMLADCKKEMLAELTVPAHLVSSHDTQLLDTHH